MQSYGKILFYSLFSPQQNEYEYLFEECCEFPTQLQMI